MKKFVLTFAAFAIAAVASASEKHTIKLFQPSVIGGQELKAGEYRLELQDNNKILVKDGNRVIEADVKVESADKKYNTNSVRYLQDKVTEIRLGGTKTRLVLDSGSGNAN